MGVHADCLSALEDAKQLLTELGHEVVDRDIFLPGDMFLEAFSVMWTAGAAATLDGLALLTGRKASAENVEPMSYALAEAGRQRTAGEYLVAVAILQRLTREWAKQRADLDVLVTPTLGQPPVALGSFDVPDNPLAGLFLAAEFAPFTPLQNMTGEPAANAPLYWNAAGLPVGVQIIGRYGDEATLSARRPSSTRHCPGPRAFRRSRSDRGRASGRAPRRRRARDGRHRRGARGIGARIRHAASPTCCSSFRGPPPKSCSSPPAPLQA